MYYSIQDTLSIGLDACGIDVHTQESMPDDALWETFCKHYGSSALVLAEMWYDLTVTTIVAAALSPDKDCLKGFMMFLAAHFFIWTYPKNCSLMASRFGVCDKYVQGERLWKWIGKIALCWVV